MTSYWFSIICIIIGLLLVGSGGVLTTMGWQKFQEVSKNRNNISSLVAELHLNTRIQQSAIEIVKSWPNKTETKNFSQQHFKATHLTNIITSGLFDRSTPAELKVINALESYEQALAEFNSGLYIVGRHTPGMYIKPDLIHDTNAWPDAYHEALSERFRNLLELHRNMENILRERYPWAFTTSP